MLKFLRRILTVDATIPANAKRVYLNTRMGNIVFRRIDCLRDSVYNLVFFKTFAFRWKRIDDNSLANRIQRIRDKLEIRREHNWLRRINKKIDKLNHSR